MNDLVTVQVHDVVQTDPDLVITDSMSEPSWVRQTLMSCPWAVVRRSPAPLGQVPVGVRGATRNQRWSGFCLMAGIRKIKRPESLLFPNWLVEYPVRTPALNALQEMEGRWRDVGFLWGPVGSAGFELASGWRATTDRSDLDLMLRAPRRLDKDYARSLWDDTLGLQVKVDVLVETPECGFSLEEYVRTPSSRILLRHAQGPRFGYDPWNPS